MKNVFITLLVLATSLLFTGFAEAQYSASTNDEETSNSGERVMQPEYGSGLEGDPDEPVIEGVIPNPADSPEKASPALTQPSVGGKDSTSSTEGTAQRNESDLEFLTRLPSLNISGTEIRGWDPEKKESFLEDVKEHAEVESGEDLENFARGVFLRDERVEEIQINEDSVVVLREVPARFLGLFESSLREEARITFGDGEYGRVKVKFPWYRFMYRLSNTGAEIEERIEDALSEGFEEEAKEGGQSTLEHRLPSRAATFLDALLSI